MFHSSKIRKFIIAILKFRKDFNLIKKPSHFTNETVLKFIVNGF